MTVPPFGAPLPATRKHEGKAGLELVFIPKGRGVLMMSIPEPDELVGIARGAPPTRYRDGDDRF